MSAFSSCSYWETHCGEHTTTSIVSDSENNLNKNPRFIVLANFKASQNEKLRLIEVSQCEWLEQCKRERRKPNST